MKKLLSILLTLTMILSPVGSGMVTAYASEEAIASEAAVEEQSGEEAQPAAAETAAPEEESIEDKEAGPAAEQPAEAPEADAAAEDAADADDTPADAAEETLPAEDPAEEGSEAEGEAEAKTLTGITVDTAEAKTEYTFGLDTELDFTGLVVTAGYSDESTLELEDGTYTIDDESVDLTVADTYVVTVSYTEGDVTVTADFDVVVAPALRAKSVGTVLAFTSDIHNSSDNTAANRLKTWISKIQGMSQYGGIDVYGFCGDMGAAQANESQFWTYTRAVMDVIDSNSIDGVYTTGNHEFYNGQFSSTSNSIRGEYIIGEQAREGSNYRIYCLGTDNWTGNRDNYTAGQISLLQNYLSSVDASKPIIILTHFPLHRFSSRSTTNADQVIDVLNAAAESGKTIVLLWGHNHTVSDTFYDEIYEPGRTIPYNSSGSTKTIQFYYGAAGCMSDSEYSGSGGGSAFVKGKGLVIQISSSRMSLAYYDANGNNVTENSGKEVDIPLVQVDATGVSLTPEAAEVEVGRRIQLTAQVLPEDASNRKVTWTSSDASIATVDENGRVKGISAGTVTITATTVDGGHTDTCAVTVTPRITTDPEYVIVIGNHALSTEVSDDEYSSSSGSWWGSSSTYRGLAGVSYQTGAGADETIRWIIEETDGGYYIKSLDGKYLNATYTSSGSSWNSSSTSLLKLDNTEDVWVLDDGVDLDSWEVDGSYLKSTNADRYLCEQTGTQGTSIFTVRSKDNADETSLEEASDPIAVTGITVNPTTATVEARKTVTLSATVTPANATNKTVTWSSSDTAVATVSSSGVVRGVAEGNATITATTADGGKTATCAVTVTASTSTETHYVILIDGYALSTEVSPNTAQGGSASYTYTGLAGVAYADGDAADDSIRWIIEAADGGYYIKDLSGRYLYGDYDSGSNSGHGHLMLGDTPDVWVLDDGYSLDSGTVNGSLLKSSNASAGLDKPKYLGYEESPADALLQYALRTMRTPSRSTRQVIRWRSRMLLSRLKQQLWKRARPCS